MHPCIHAWCFNSVWTTLSCSRVLIGPFAFCLSGGAGAAEAAGGGGWGAVPDRREDAQHHHQEEPEEGVRYRSLVLPACPEDFVYVWKWIWICCWQIDLTVNQPEGRISHFLVERSTVYSVELKSLINLTRKTFFFSLHNENRSVLKKNVNFLSLKERWYYEITVCRQIFPILALLLQDYLLYYFITLFAVGVTTLFVFGHTLPQLFSPILTVSLGPDLHHSCFPNCFQVVRETAESCGEGPPEGPGEGGVRPAVWRLHEPERHQGPRNVWEACGGWLAQSSNGTRLVLHNNF